MIVAPPTIVNAIEDALSPFGVRIYEQHVPPARILELISTAVRGGARPGSPAPGP
jgi:aerobic carbon-monoxide dehydrogenase large subunit